MSSIHILYNQALVGGLSASPAPATQIGIVSVLSFLRCVCVIAMVIALFEGRLWSTALMIKGGLGKGKHSLGEKTPRA